MTTTVINIRDLEGGPSLRHNGKGMPENHVYIGRSTKWGNPYPMGMAPEFYTREQVIKAFRKYLHRKLSLAEAARTELKDKVLVCWCAPLACHGDVLAEVANEAGKGSE